MIIIMQRGKKASSNYGVKFERTTNETQLEIEKEKCGWE